MTIWRPNALTKRRTIKLVQNRRRTLIQSVCFHGRKKTPGTMEHAGKVFASKCSSLSHRSRARLGTWCGARSRMIEDSRQKPIKIKLASLRSSAFTTKPLIESERGRTWHLADKLITWQNKNLQNDGSISRFSTNGLSIPMRTLRNNAMQPKTAEMP